VEIVASPYGPIRLTTIVAAALAFGVVTFRTRKPLLAAVTVMACLWSYEVVWNATDISVHHWGWAPEWYWGMLATGWTGWMLAAGWRPSVWLLALFAVAHAAWVVSGFHYNWAHRPWTTSGEIWNVVTKTLWIAAWAAGSKLDAVVGSATLVLGPRLTTSFRSEGSPSRRRCS
jgi:hypothetical protein